MRRGRDRGPRCREYSWSRQKSRQRARRDFMPGGVPVRVVGKVGLSPRFDLTFKSRGKIEHWNTFAHTKILQEFVQHQPMGVNLLDLQRCFARRIVEVNGRL